jgi:hypothetical protein
MADQPSWMQSAAPPPPPPPPPAAAGGGAAGAGGGSPPVTKLGDFTRNFLHLGNIGCCVMMAFSAVLGLFTIADADITSFFLGIYMLVFAFILFMYELVRMSPFGSWDDLLRQQFGLVYGNQGRGLYLIFVGFLNFGLDGSFSFWTGIVVVSWGALTILAFYFRPHWFEVEQGK